MADVKEHIDFDVEFNDNADEANRDYSKVNNTLKSVDKALNKVNSSAEKVSHTIDKLSGTVNRFARAMESNASEAANGYGKVAEQVEQIQTPLNGIKRSADQAAVAVDGLATAIEGITVESEIDKEIKGLSQEVTDIKDRFEGIFSSGDLSGLKNAVTYADELNKRLVKMQDVLAGKELEGEDVSSEIRQVGDLQRRMNAVGRDVGVGLKKNLKDNIRSAIDSASRLAKAALRKSFSLAKQLTQSWVRFLDRSFKSVIGVWRSLIGKIFGGRSGSGNNLLSGLFGVASIAGLIALSKQMIGLSADMFEVQNVIEGVFGSAEQEINDFCDTSIEKFGLTALEARKLAGTFGGILKASNIIGDAQQEMSKNLTALSGDIASFYNITVDEASAKLQSGLVGNVSAMRSLGINMTVANLEAYALSKGITTSWQSLDQATKTTLRYNYILEQTRDAQGDYAKTFGSWANQVRLLTSNLKQLASILGGALIKALYPVLSVLNQIVSAAINAANALARAFNFQAVDLAKLFGGSGGITLPDTSDYEEGMEDVADATNDAADATAKLNDNLQSFDRLNNITTPTTTKAGGATTGVSSGVGGLLDFDSYYKNVKELDVVVNEKLQKVLNVIKQWVKDVASVDYRNIKAAWGNLADAFKPVAEDAGKAIQWLWKSVLFPFYEWSATQGAPAVIDLLAEGLRALHEILIAVAPEIDDFWQNTLAPYFSAKGEAFTQTLKDWTAELKNWTKGLQDADDKLGYLKKTLEDLKAKLYSWIGDSKITDRLDSIGGHINSIWKKLKDGSVLAQVKKLLSTFTKLSLIVFDNILGMADWLTGNEEVTEFVDFLVDQFGDLTDYSFDKLKDILQYIATSDDAKKIVVNIKDAIKNIIDWVDEHKEDILSLLSKASSLLEKVSEHIDAVLIGLGAIAAIKGISSLVTTFTNLKTALSGISGLLGGGGAAGAGTGLASSLAATGHSLGGTLAAAVVAGAVGWGIGSKIYDAWGDEIDEKVHPIVDDIVDLFGQAKDEITKGDTIDSFTRKLDEVSDDEAEMTLRANELAKAHEGAFKFDPNTEIYVDYANKIKKATDAFNGLEERVRNIIANGQEGVETWDGAYVSLDTLQDSIYGYVAALREAGYANEDLLGKLEDLSFKNVGLLDVSGKRELKDDIISTWQEIMYDVEAERQSVMQMSEADFRDAFFPEGYTAKLQEAAENAVNAIQTGATAAVETGTNLELALRNKMTSSIAAVTGIATQQSTQLGAATVTGIDTGIKSKAANISSALKATLTTARAGAQALVGQFTTIGANTAEGVAVGMRSHAATIASAAQNIISNAAAAMRAAAQIHSPSRLFADIAQYIPEGVAMGISDNTYVVSDAMTNMVSSMEQDVLTNQVDMSGIIDASRFSDKYQDILYQTEDFNKEMAKYGDMTPAEYQSSMLTSPRVKQAQLSANIAQSGVSTLSEGISALYGQARGAKADTGRVIQCQIVVGSTQFAQFIIDTVTGQAIQTGNF